MRIVFISDWFAEKMGYAENCLPKAMAALGHEVHVVTSNVQPYFDSPAYKETYEPFIGPGVVDCEVKELDGYTLHRLPYARWQRRLRIKGLVGQLRALRPDIVQTFDTLSVTTWEAACARLLLGYKLFLESHLHASVFSVPTVWQNPIRRFKWFAYSRTVGSVISHLSEKCYPISTDAAEIVLRYFGVPGRKVRVVPLGVDTDLFRPASDGLSQQMRSELREKLGFAQSDIVCVYTGRFSGDKGPVILAQAIGQLVARGEPFRGLFVGNGTQLDVAAIRGCPGCVAHPFVPVRELPPFYWAADIGMWPKQESTSQLDAAACGLPLILSDRVQVRERIEGNGLTYKEGDVSNLTEQIATLADPNLRQRLGDCGRRKMQEQFSWDRIARERLQDYEAALKR